MPVVGIITKEPRMTLNSGPERTLRFWYLLEIIILAPLETLTYRSKKTATEITYLLFYKTYTPANVLYLVISY